MRWTSEGAGSSDISDATDQDERQSDGNGDDAATHLPQERAPADAGMAGATASTQRHETDEGDELKPLEYPPAAVAARPPARRGPPSTRRDNACVGPDGTAHECSENDDNHAHPQSVSPDRRSSASHHRSMPPAAYTGAVLRRLVSRVSLRESRAAFIFVLAAYVFFSLFDWITTVVALDVGGREGNPIAASVFSVFGNAGLLVFKLMVIAVIIGVLVFIPRRIMSLRVATWVGAAFAIVAAVIVIHNMQAYVSLQQQPHGPTYHSTAPGARLL